MTKSSCQLPQLLLAVTLEDELQAYANWIACLVQLKLVCCLEPDMSCLSRLFPIWHESNYPTSNSHFQVQRS